MSALQALRSAIPDNVDALLIGTSTNVLWATDFTGSFGYAIVTRDGGRFLTDSRYTLQAKEQVTELESFTFASPVDGDEFLAQNLKELGVHRLGFEASGISYARWAKWSEKLKPIELVPVDGIVEGLRMIKTEAQIEKTREAAKLADATFDHVLKLLRPGLTEYDVALEIEFFTRRHGASNAFDIIAVSGERSARPHGTPSDKPLQDGDFLTLDFGAKLDGYHSDLTRTVVIGTPTDRHREHYGAVLEAELAAIEMMKPGVPAKDVDALARQILGKYGLAEYFGHGLGHTLGLTVHDGGRMSATSNDILTVGQIWTVEPGAYVPPFGGVRIEDDVVVRENGVEVLTSAPKELIAIPWS
ncbi:aminopeptidase P family protein [bacterium]|nr:MAG: aminopeptidase P family protein [bacterium]